MKVVMKECRHDIVTVIHLIGFVFWDLELGLDLGLRLVNKSIASIILPDLTATRMECSV